MLFHPKLNFLFNYLKNLIYYLNLLFNKFILLNFILKLFHLFIHLLDN